MKRADMSVWPGLLAAPVAVVGAQSINYALVQEACRTGSHVALDAVSAAGFLFCVAAAWLAYRRWRTAASVPAANYVSHGARRPFFALMAMVVAALCALIQLMMWFPQWLLSPCR
ncbi:hypothetical protein [Paraburkholderia sp. BL17N1]|uniref:hypothetical protein n=1 Tax=Paraburkholderia sp. BL17N1 TaxID=1938798 RepID=UPI000F145F13|nr:hypothetical protein [Paraburkholderia sp. BL17N1]RKR31547.1 hypothetical protein B0G82_7736 [Paraburkholderia sp. BL17N1]